MTINNIILRKIALVTACFFMLLSCDDDEETTVPDNTPQGSYIRATIDGKEFSTNVDGIETVVVTNLYGSIQITGTNSIGDVIQLNLDEVTVPGTYTVNNDSASLLVYSDFNNTKEYGTGPCDDASGTVVVTAITDTKIEGTFMFTGREFEDCSSAKTVSNGSFRGVFTE
jgi:hypothetical protein